MPAAPADAGRSKHQASTLKLQRRSRPCNARDPVPGKTFRMCGESYSIKAGASFFQVPAMYALLPVAVEEPTLQDMAAELHSTTCSVRSHSLLLLHLVQFCIVDTIGCGDVVMHVAIVILVLCAVVSTAVSAGIRRDAQGLVAVSSFR